MIESFFQALIKELGAVGLLVLGLAFIIYHATLKISTPLKTINGEIGEIRDLLKAALTRMTK